MDSQIGTGVLIGASGGNPVLSQAVKDKGHLLYPSALLDRLHSEKRLLVLS